MLRLLDQPDYQALEDFLSRRPTALIMRSNARRAGLRDKGRPLQATYAAAWNGDEITAVAAHCWNGTLLVEAPVRLGEVSRLAVRSSGRPVRALHGPSAQATLAREALGLGDRASPTASVDLFYDLDLAKLNLPRNEGALHCRASTERDLPLLGSWRHQFLLEAFGVLDSPERQGAAEEEVRRWHELGEIRVLEAQGQPVCTFNFIARMPDSIMLGGVWTPVAARGRGYARRLIGQALLQERANGVRKAELFVAPDNPAAQRCYEALGFTRAGEYGLIIFDEA